MTFAMGRRFVIADGVERWKEAEVDPVANALRPRRPRDADGRVLRPRGGPVQGARRSFTRRSRRPAARSPPRTRSRPWGLPKWLSEQAAALSIDLDKEGAKALVAQVGDRQQRLLRELEKLALEHGAGDGDRRRGGRGILRHLGRAKVWTLADALVAGDRKTSLELLLELRRQGERVTGLIYNMVRRLRDAVAVAEELQAGQSPPQVKKTCGCRPGPADKFVKDVGRRATSTRSARRWRRWPTSSSRARRRRRSAQRGHARAVVRRFSSRAAFARVRLRDSATTCRWKAPDPPLVSPFPPIADYGFLSDCETCALVAPSGAIEWMCLPRYDGPSVFGALLDRDAGTFRLGPADTMVPAARRYLPGTMILETSWGTDRGWLIVRDVLLIGPWHDTEERSSDPPPRAHGPRRRPRAPAHDALRQRLRRGPDGVRPDLRLRPPLRAVGVRRLGLRRGGRHRAEGWPTKLTLTTDLRVGFEGSRVRAVTTLHDGDTAFVALAFSDHPGPKTYEEAYDRLVKTADYWHQWLAHGTFPDHPWRQYLQRSALTLKGLTYSPTGAMIAAATTSLPETPGGVRNWDYRYSWVRDSTFMLWGLHSLGFEWEANDYFYFMQDAAQADDLQVMYGIQGERELIEETLDHLSGYDNARPVRIGNGAYNQRQHDVWGTMLDSIFLHAKSRDHLPERRWPLIERLVEAAIEQLAEARQGHLGGPRRGQALHLLEGHVLGRLRPRRPPGDAARGPRARRPLARKADEIKADIIEKGCKDGVFTQHYDTDALDASRAADPARALPAARRRARQEDRDGDRQPPDGRRARAALSRRATPTTGSRARRARSRSARSGS